MPFPLKKNERIIDGMVVNMETLEPQYEVADEICEYCENEFPDCMCAEDDWVNEPDFDY